MDPWIEVNLSLLSGCPDYPRWPPSSNKGSGFTMVDERAGGVGNQK